MSLDGWLIVLFTIGMIAYLVLIPLMFREAWKIKGRCEGIKIGYDKAIAEMKEMEKLRQERRPWGEVVFSDGNRTELH